VQHLTFSAALAEDRRAELRREASQVRLARAGRPRRRYLIRRWRPATATAVAVNDRQARGLDTAKTTGW
jgi:hypothetical protein